MTDTCTISTVTLGGSEYSLQHTLRDLHMLHGDDLAEFLQGLDVADFIHELHTAEKHKQHAITATTDLVWKLQTLILRPGQVAQLSLCDYVTVTLSCFVMAWVYKHKTVSLWYDFVMYLLSSLCLLDLLREGPSRLMDHKHIFTWWKVSRWPGQSGWTTLGERWWDTLDSSSVCRRHSDIQVFVMSFSSII